MPPSSSNEQALATLSDLVRAGVVQPGTRIIASYKGAEHSAEITSEGKVRISGADQLLTLSAAARTISDSRVNGWRFWRVQVGDSEVPISRLRDGVSRSSA
jgi:hypothetical protein